jgi:hypothetical protein
MSAPGRLGRGWAARQPELMGDNANQPVGNPNANSDFGANPDVTESSRTDYGSEGWGLTLYVRGEFSRACYRNPSVYGGFGHLPPSSMPRLRSLGRGWAARLRVRMSSSRPMSATTSRSYQV